MVDQTPARVPGLMSRKISKLLEKGLTPPHALTSEEVVLLCSSIQHMMDKRKAKKAAATA